MTKILKVIFSNFFVLLILIISLETLGFIGRKLLNKSSVGWVYRTDSQTLVLEEFPCNRIETHPVLSHTPNHKGECEIFDGYVNGTLVEYFPEINKSIVVLGGSTTSGFYQHYADGKTWPLILSKILKKNNYNYNVINGGHGGYSSSEELMQLLLNIRRLNTKVEIIISLNGINDLNLQNRKNYFLGNRVIEMYERQMFIDQSFLSRYLPNIFSFIRFISPDIDPGYNMGKRELNKISNIKKMKNFEIWQSNVEIMHAIGKSMNANYFVFLQPTMGLEGTQSIMPSEKNSIDAKMLSVILNDKGGEIESYRSGYRKKLNKNYKKFKEKCENLNFCFDITQVAPPSNENNYSNPRHHNENGNKIIANEIFRILQKKRVLK